LCAYRRGVEEKDATCNWHFHLLKSFSLINSYLWLRGYRWKGLKRSWI
jgi:hypothetical protein